MPDRMTITLHVPTMLRDCCAGASELAVTGASLRVLLEELERRHPALVERDTGAGSLGGAALALRRIAGGGIGAGSVGARPSSEYPERSSRARAPEASGHDDGERRGEGCAR